MLGCVSYQLVSTSRHPLPDFLGYFFYQCRFIDFVQKYLILLKKKIVNFIGFGIPVLGFYMLYRNRYRLDDMVTYSKYSFLYEGYKNDKYYWEFVILIRKILIIICSVFMTSSGPQIQVKI